jgi:hypothetical protein
MALLRIKRRPSTGTRPAIDAEQRMAFQAELPGPAAGLPLVQVSIELAERTEADGARMRLRAHLRTNLGNSETAPPTSTDAGPPPSPPPRKGPVQVLARGVGRTLGNALQRPFIKALAAPLLEHEINTWFEVQVSTEPLDGGAAALLPAPERLARLGIVPRTDKNAPLVESWVGETSGREPGFAQLSLLRLARDQLPPRLAALLGSRPFQLAATVVNVVEPKHSEKQADK